MKLLVLLLLYIFATLCIGDEKKYFYIYEWPEYFSDVWPPAGAQLDPSTPYSHDFRSNITGVGRPIDPDIGYFNTWQFSLYKLAMARLLVDERRTLDPSKATSYIIPFDIGVHSLIDHKNGRLRVASPHGWRVIEYFKTTAGQHVFNKNGFHDHFALVSIDLNCSLVLICLQFSVTSYQISGIGSKVFLTDLCQNCTVLTIETTPTNTARRYYSDKSRKWWYAVPYPSSFHWWEGIKTIPWIRTAASPLRKYTAVFIGSRHTATPSSNLLRRKLYADCQAENQTCLWFDAAHLCTGMFNNTDNMLFYRQSTFCLAPTGDSLTRKSLFDSLLTGCIPVIFARGTMSQYSWFFPKELETIAVYISMQDVIEGTNFMSVLKSISPEKIRDMQDRIERLAPSLQYSIVPEGYGTPRSKTFDGDTLSATPKVYPRGPVWKPPVPDAMDVIIERILDRRTVEPMEGFTPEFVLRSNDLRDNVSRHDPPFVGLNDGKSELLAIMNEDKRKHRKRKPGPGGHH